MKTISIEFAVVKHDEDQPFEGFLKFAVEARFYGEGGDFMGSRVVTDGSGSVREFENEDDAAKFRQECYDSLTRLTGHLLT